MNIVSKDARGMLFALPSKAPHVHIKQKGLAMPSVPSYALSYSSQQSLKQ